MKREIKFRAWDTFRNEMSKVISIKWATKDDAGGLVEFDDGGDCFYEDVVLMQFTGLKDKNGKEIFEGDITKTLFMGQKGIIIGEVIWADSGFYVGYKEYKDNLFPWVFYKMVEVIGNIYENPELLKDLDVPKTEGGEDG